MEEKDKKIDDNWKEAVEKEKEGLAKQGKFIPEAPTFNFFISTLALQAAISLGHLENPVTNKKEENLPQARFIIDTLDMLRDKTKANLSKEEADALNTILYELRVQYIAKAQGEQK